MMDEAFIGIQAAGTNRGVARCGLAIAAPVGRIMNGAWINSVTAGFAAGSNERLLVCNRI